METHLIERLHRWFTATLRRVSGTSDIAGAIRYALSRWEALIRYLDDGTLAIDNNAVERDIRPLALGRKNWVFAGSDAGGKRAAAIYSLIETAKLNGLDPEAYLRHVLDRIADHPGKRIAGVDAFKQGRFLTVHGVLPPRSGIGCLRMLSEHGSRRRHGGGRHRGDSRSGGIGLCRSASLLCRLATPGV